MFEWIDGFIHSIGYPGILLLMFLENVFPFIPSETIMPLAGFMTAQGELSFVGVVAAGTVGSVIGNLPLYYLGKFVGKEKLKAWANKHGKWLMISGKDIDKADDWFDRHGHKAVLFCRLIPGIRSLISIPAGFAGMKFSTFLLYSALGTGLWSVLLAYLGRSLGKNYEEVEQYMSFAAYIVLGIIAVICVCWTLKRSWAKRV